tara:strand:+ start:842 stop:1171 length:330 start_codon:yes stop_codon:yes gene_type:complete
MMALVLRNMTIVLDGLRISHRSEPNIDLHSKNVKLDVGEMAMCLELLRVAGRGNFYGHLLRWICFVVVNVGWQRRQSRLVYAKYCMGVRTDTITNSVTPVMEKTSKTKK